MKEAEVEARCYVFSVSKNWTHMCFSRQHLVCLG